TRTQVPQSLEKHVGLMKRLAFWHFIEQFEDSAFRRRDHERPLPFSPRLPYIAAAHEYIVGFFTGIHDDVVREQSLCIVQNEPALQIQLEDPGWTLVCAIQMYFPLWS